MDITSANATYILSVPGVFAAQQVLQGFATDDAFSTPEVDVAEVYMGVDGLPSGGFVPFLVKQMIVFQADSPSIANTMEAWLGAMQSAFTPYTGSAIITIPSVQRQYKMSKGFLSRITPVTQAKKVLQPVSYEITWGSWQAQPFSLAQTVVGLVNTVVGAL